jgi:hypothetical protein
MKVELEVPDTLCSTSKFIINQVKGDSREFGNQHDNNPGMYGCGNMIFEGKPSTQFILEKYNISEEEYEKIVRMLEVKLSFGHCGWCV